MVLHFPSSSRSEFSFFLDLNSSSIFLVIPSIGCSGRSSHPLASLTWPWSSSSLLNVLQHLLHWVGARCLLYRCSLPDYVSASLQVRDLVVPNPLYATHFNP